MHSVTDRQTDGQQAAGNSRSYCVAVRSAKNDNFYYITIGPITIEKNVVDNKLERLCTLNTANFDNHTVA